MIIQNTTKDPVINICLDTIKIKKQAIVFCGSKRSAEKQAEDLAKKIKEKNENLEKLSLEFENCLPNPTKQCKRDAYCIKNGIAFHHAGLVSKQRNLIEDSFRNGLIKIICSTPTLAAGLDMPAFRTVLKDLKRYSSKWGMQFIPVLEYHQMAGRAGRPGKEDYGEAIAISKNQTEKQKIKNNYIDGESEPIQSKLAVEPVLRTYVLSLIATGFVNCEKELVEFFSKTFYAYQFEDMKKLSKILDKVLLMLKDYSFIEFENENDFSSALSLSKNKEISIKVTPLGKRVSELYLDPFTANELINALKKNKKSDLKNNYVGLIHAVVDTIEMEPLLSVKNNEVDSICIVLSEWEDILLKNVHNEFSYEFEDFLRTIKTTLFFKAWIDEIDEEILLERFNIRPGETRAKLENADWLLRCAIELAKFTSLTDIISDIYRLQIRLKYGVKEELIPLLRLKGIGRVRARSLFNSGFKGLNDFNATSFEKVKNIVGVAMAENIYNQMGKNFKKNDLTDFM